MAGKKRITFIVNPVSGTRGKRNVVQDIERFLDKDLFDHRVETTLRAGHASVLAREAMEAGADIVVAVGGDGTVNEVASALVGGRTALGILPCGSGDGLARHLQIPLNVRGAVEILNQCRIEPLDYATVCGKPFFVTCGMGFDAYVSRKFAEAGTRGLLTYLEQTLVEWLRYKPETYVVEDAAGRESHEAFLITCANSSEYGNNAYIAPQASMSDGMLDVTIIEPFNALEAPQLAMQLFTGTLRSGRGVRMFRTDALTVRRERPGMIHCDGDPVEAGSDLEFRLVHGGINIVTNPAARIGRSNVFQSLAAFADGLQTRALALAGRGNPMNIIRKNRASGGGQS